MPPKTCKKYNVILVILILIGIVIRLLSVVTTQTHYDDIGVAVSYLWDLNPQSVVTGLKRLDFIWQYGWTYAPFQLFFTTLLLSNKNSYFINLVMGRLPSFVVGSVNILLMYFIIKNAYKKSPDTLRKVWLPILAVILIGFSWENIIYSAFAAPYEIGVFATGILLVMYLLEDKDNLKMQYWSFPLLGILCYMQYQIFIFVFAFYIERFFFYTKNKKYKFLVISILSSISCVLITSPLLYKVVTLGLLNRGTNWNVGTDNQFLFDFSKGVIENILFFINNNLYSFSKFLCFK